MTKMNPNLKANWISALRSGAFVQGRTVLRSNKEPYSYCCLGVLCEISGQEAGSTPYVWCDNTISGPAVSECIEMNDVQGKTFPEIADWIDANL